MSSLKNIGGRVGYFIGGIVLTVLGGFLVYFEFKSQQRSTNSGSWPSYPFIILVLGLASIAVAFSSNKKPVTPDNSNDSQLENKIINEDQNTGP